jgi:hypothetical protein
MQRARRPSCCTPATRRCRFIHVWASSYIIWYIETVFPFVPNLWRLKKALGMIGWTGQ